MFSIVWIEWPRREVHEAYVTSSLAWLSLTGNDVRRELPLLSPSAKQVHPKDNSEVLEYVLNALLGLHFSPNVALTPHINAFTINPLPFSVAILISYGREVTWPLVRKSPCILEPVKRYLHGSPPTILPLKGPCCLDSYNGSLQFGGLVLGLKLGIKLLRMPHAYIFPPK